MENERYNKIVDKFLKNIESLDTVEKTSTISIFIIALIYGIIQVFFMCFFIQQNIPDMIFVSATSVLICILNLYCLTDTKKLSISLMLWIINSCFTVLATTHVLGYNKNSFVFLPVLLLLIHFIFPKKRKYILINTIMVLVTFCLNIFFKYATETEYQDSLHFIEIANTFFALMLSGLIIHLKSKADKIVEKYNAKQLDNLSEEVEKLSAEASMDFLTGIWNRRYAETQLDIESFDDSFVVIADIDLFEQINIKYGNLCGDYILIEVAHFLKSSFRNLDVVCRWGGEEFLILMRGVNKLDVIVKLDKIKNTIQHTNYEFNENKFNITMTFGFAKLDKKSSLDENVEKAHLALKDGKNNGKNCIRSYTEGNTNNKLIDLM